MLCGAITLDVPWLPKFQHGGRGVPTSEQQGKGCSVASVLLMYGISVAASVF